MKDIKDFEGLYAVTEDGKVWGYQKEWISGRPPSRVSVKAHWMKQKKHRKGYPIVGLHNKMLKKTYLVHRLVALAFIPNPFNLPQVNHINGIKTDNRVENLEWCTNSQNWAHGLKLGLVGKQGEQSHASKLTEKQVLKIREMYKSGSYSQQAIADIFPISRENVGQIIRRTRWKHI